MSLDIICVYYITTHTALKYFIHILKTFSRKYWLVIVKKFQKYLGNILLIFFGQKIQISKIFS